MSISVNCKINALWTVRKTNVLLTAQLSELKINGIRIAQLQICLRLITNMRLAK